MTEAVSNHPLAGRTSAFTAWVGALIAVIAAVVLFTILVGRWQPSGLQLRDVTIPPEVFVVPIALWVYWRQKRVSLLRPRTWFYATLDFVSSLTIFAVAAVGVASWFPPVAATLAAVSLPVAVFTSFTVVAGVTFLAMSIWDLTINHFRRAERGRDGIAETTTSTTPAAATSAAPSSTAAASPAPVPDWPFHIKPVILPAVYLRPGERVQESAEAVSVAAPARPVAPVVLPAETPPVAASTAESAPKTSTV